MFKCQGENYCVPHHEVCDGVKHCRMYGDDEKYCEPAGMLYIIMIIMIINHINSLIYTRTSEASSQEINPLSTKHDSCF